MRLHVGDHSIPVHAPSAELDAVTEMLRERIPVALQAMLGQHQG